ncbi:MAG: tetratricopeptide repeat protein [Anaerolineae bacterium]|nr:tetratricopeptide repeat protein [Anaerolineae bacterium]
MPGVGHARWGAHRAGAGPAALGRRAEALAALRTAQTLTPDDPQVYYELGMTYAQRLSAVAPRPKGILVLIRTWVPDAPRFAGWAAFTRPGASERLNNKTDAPRFAGCAAFTPACVRRMDLHTITCARC